MPSLNNNFAFNWANSFNTSTYELRRQVFTTDSDGGESSSESKISDITASIQPLNESDLISVPDGDREVPLFKLYTKYAIKKNDIIIYNGERYQIKKPPLPWIVENQIHHYKTFINLIENE